MTISGGDRSLQLPPRLPLDKGNDEIAMYKHVLQHSSCIGAPNPVAHCDEWPAAVPGGRPGSVMLPARSRKDLRRHLLRGSRNNSARAARYCGRGCTSGAGDCFRARDGRVKEGYHFVQNNPLALQ